MNTFEPYNDDTTEDYPEALHYLDDPYELVTARGYLTAQRVA